MALPVNGSTHLIPALLLIYRPRKDERLSWPSWLTCSGWFTLISGHPSAAGRAQDRESSPVGDRRSTTVLRHQPFTFYLTLLRTPSCEFLARHSQQQQQQQLETGSVVAFIVYSLHNFLRFSSEFNSFISPAGSIHLVDSSLSATVTFILITPSIISLLSYYHFSPHSTLLST